MNVVIVGGHGQIARRLEKLLLDRGDSPRGIIRKTEQAKELEDAGVEPIVLDIENVDDITDAFAGADAAVFAAGAGPGSGPARKLTVDFGGAEKSIAACLAREIKRFLMVSAMGVNHPENWSDEMRPYLQAKADADQLLVDSGLDYTIVRPGGLTDDPGTGKVEVGESLDYGKVTRDDVAAVLAECLTAPSSVGKAFDLLNGDTPVPEAISAL